MNSQEVATIIRSQISLNTFLCVGASDFTYGTTEEGNSYLSFRTRIDNQRRYIKIILNGSDYYDLEQNLVRGGKTSTKFKATDIFCEDLSETVYRMGSTKMPAEGWLEEMGIHTC